MKLYTAGSTIANREACQRLGVGLMIVDHWRNPSYYPHFAIDNGCYSAWSRGAPWDPVPFLKSLAKCRELGLKPDFVVIPDVVANADASTLRSYQWYGVLKDLYPEFPLYWAVQDGMDPNVLPRTNIDGIFVGGSMQWKLETMAQWAETARTWGIPIHVGRIGTPERMVMAHWAGIDSIDSTTWVQRNGCLEHHVKEYRERVGA